MSDEEGTAKKIAAEYFASSDEDAIQAQLDVLAKLLQEEGVD